MAARDSLAKLGQRFKGPRGFMLALILLLAVRILISVKELGGTTKTVGDPQRFTPKLILTRESETFTDVQDLLTQWPEFEQSKFKPLADINMFDIKGIQQTEGLERQADEFYTQAFTLLRQGNPESLVRAEQLINEAFKITPRSQRIRQLRDEIVKAREAAGVASSAGGATTPTLTQ